MKNLLKKNLIMSSLLLLLVVMISGFDNINVYAKSNSTIKKTNKKADKAYMKVVKKLFQDLSDECDANNLYGVTVDYLFKDLTGDGIHEAIITYRLDDGGSGGYEYAIYTYKKKKAKRILVEGGNPTFKICKESNLLVTFDWKKGWEWYNCYTYNGKKYVHLGESRRLGEAFVSYYENPSGTMTDEEFYALLNEYCHGELEEINSADFTYYSEKRLKNTGYSGADVFSAYLNLIQGEKSKMDKYNWQRGYYGYGTMTDDMISRPVAFADVYGDDTPELIYFAYNDSYGYDYADMHIVTYEDGKVKQLFEGYADSEVAGGTNYYLFQLKGEKTLYLYDAFGDINWIEDYCIFEDSDKGLIKSEKYRKVNIGEAEFPYSEYYQEKINAISESTFEKAIESMQNNTATIIMSTKFSNGFAKNFVEEKGCTAMTSDEAIEYLKSIVE